MVGMQLLEMGNRVDQQSCKPFLCTLVKVEKSTNPSSKKDCGVDRYHNLLRIDLSRNGPDFLENGNPAKKFRMKSQMAAFCDVSTPDLGGEYVRKFDLPLLVDQFR